MLSPSREAELLLLDEVPTPTLNVDTALPASTMGSPLFDDVEPYRSSS